MHHIFLNYKHSLIKYIQGTLGKSNVIIGYNKKFVYLFNKKTVIKAPRKDVKVKFIKGLPNGTFKIKLNKHKILTINNIKYQRVFDFLQDLKPKRIYKANYDFTSRLQNALLSDPAHASYIDKLRYAMQRGQISQHDYDSLNPLLSKAGK